MEACGGPIFYLGREIDLPPCAKACLAALVRRAPEAVSYQELVRQALGIRLNWIDAQDFALWRITRIRQAIEPDPHHPTCVISVPGVGYRLNVE